MPILIYIKYEKRSIKTSFNNKRTHREGEKEKNRYYKKAQSEKFSWMLKALRKILECSTALQYVWSISGIIQFNSQQNYEHDHDSKVIKALNSTYIHKLRLKALRKPIYNILIKQGSFTNRK